MSDRVENVGTEILRVLCGSRAYGLETPDSDYDYHGVFVVPTSRILSLDAKVKDTAWIEGDEQDNTAWEVGHFLKMAINGNPTVLETFVAPIESANRWGEWLRNLFPHVLSKSRIYHAFRGYAGNQRKKMFEPDGQDEPAKARRAKKAAIAWLRSLYHGLELLSNHTYNPHIEGSYFRDRLLYIRDAERIEAASVVEMAMELEDRLTEAFMKSNLPEQPNITVVNEFLLDIRKVYW